MFFETWFFRLRMEREYVRTYWSKHKYCLLFILAKHSDAAWMDKHEYWSCLTQRFIRIDKQTEKYKEMK